MQVKPDQLFDLDGRVGVIGFGFEVMPLDEVPTDTAFQLLLLSPGFARVGSLGLVVWPSAFGKSCEELESSDVDDLMRLEYEGLDSDCEAFGSYVGPRIEISVEGFWTHFAIGGD